MYHKYTGVILKKYPLGEADELLTIFTREVGKLRVKAGASRKIQSRLAGYLQSLNEVEFETVGPRGSSGLPIIISARARMINNYLRENLKKFAYALVGIETLYRISPDKQDNPQAYQALLKFLQDLGSSPSNEAVAVRAFQLRILSSCGFAFPVENYRLTPAVRNQILVLTSGQSIESLLPEVEVVIDNFLNYVLEREIKSGGFLRTLNTEV